MDIKRSWDLLTEKQKNIIIDKIIGYFEKDRNEQIGVVAAEQILDFFLDTAGGAIYNNALNDIKPLMEQELANSLINVDISLRKEEVKSSKDRH